MGGILPRCGSKTRDLGWEYYPFGVKTPIRRRVIQALIDSALPRLYPEGVAFHSPGSRVSSRTLGTIDFPVPYPEGFYIPPDHQSHTYLSSNSIP